MEQVIKLNPLVSSIPDVEITRMDFIVLANGNTIVNKLGTGLKGNMVVMHDETKSNFDLDKALAWCTAKGWTVRRWPGGARAWKYGLKPVRSAREIIHMRSDLINNPRPELNGMGVNLDLAYDL